MLIVEMVRIVAADELILKVVILHPVVTIMADANCHDTCTMTPAPTSRLSRRY
jgi:hypothetical protein